MKKIVSVNVNKKSAKRIRLYSTLQQRWGVYFGEVEIVRYFNSDFSNDFFIRRG